MADQSSITTGVPEAVIAAIQSAKTLHETVKRYEVRNKTLQYELEGLLSVLEVLGAVSGLEASILSQLAPPIDRCTQLCRDFEISMRAFSGKSKAGFRDWAKLEFMRGDINEFMDTLAVHRSTISLGLVAIIMKTSKPSHKVLEEYGEMIEETKDNLNAQLQRIDETLVLVTKEGTKGSDVSVDLRYELSVTKQCLRICDGASSYLAALMDQEPSLQPGSAADATDDAQQPEAQRTTRKASSELLHMLAETVERSREPLEMITSSTASGSDQERLQLQNDLDDAKQCLEVCEQASDWDSDQAVHRQFGGAISDHIMAYITTDLVTARRTSLVARPAAAFGVMTDETLHKLFENQHGGQFGTIASEDPEPGHPILPLELDKTTDLTAPSQNMFQVGTIEISDGRGKSPSETHTKGGTPDLGGLPDNRVASKNDQKILAAAEREDDSVESELSSNSSVWDAQICELSSATSGRPSNIMRLSIQELSDVVLNHTELARILEASASHPSLQPKKVLEEFKRLFGLYYRSIGSSSKTAGFVPVFRLLKRSRGAIIYNARKLLGLAHDSLRSLDQQMEMSSKAKMEMLHYLWQLNKENAEPLPSQIADSDIYHNIDQQSDSDGNSSIEDDPYPEISASMAFIKDGAPMQKFQAEMRRFVLETVRNCDVWQSSPSLPFSLPNIVDEFWCRLSLNLPEPSIPRGKRRIRWTCSCGLRLYDDFDERSNNDALDDLERLLNTGLPTRNYRDNDGPTMHPLPRVLSWCRGFVRLIWPHFRSRSTDGSALPMHNATAVTASTHPPEEPEPKELLYLLHCNSAGEYGVKLNQDLICENLTDRELFRFLRTVYCRAKQDVRWFSLRNVTNISLCKFYVDHSLHVSVRKHGQECMPPQLKDCVCLPPRRLVGREYQCEPTPPDDMPLPPFEKNYLMHYFLNPDHLSHAQVWAYKQLPKRMCGPLKPGCDHFPPGWGIYFEDGWNFKTLYLITSLATMIGSLIFGICWSILKLDVQAAFGITSYWIAVVVLGLGFLALRSTDKL